MSDWLSVHCSHSAQLQIPPFSSFALVTHPSRGRATHLCISMYKAVTGLDDGLSLVCRQAIVWTSDSLLSIGNEVRWILNNKTMSMQENEFENVIYKSRPLCIGLNVSKYSQRILPAVFMHIVVCIKRHHGHGDWLRPLWRQLNIGLGKYF